MSLAQPGPSIIEQRSRANALALGFAAFGLIVGGLAVLAVDVADGHTDQVQFILLNYVVFYYLLWEVWRIAKEEQLRAFLQPAVLASMVHFTICYLMPNVRYFSPDGLGLVPYGLSFVSRTTYRALNLAMWAILLASFAMWRGYRSQLAIRAAASLRKTLLKTGVMRGETDINFFTLGLLIALAIGGSLLSINLGVFGYSSDVHALSETQAVRGWIKVASEAGGLVLLVLAAAIHTPRYKNSGGTWALFVVVLLWQIAEGFLSGFKSQVVMPFIIAGAAHYAMKGRLSKSWALAALVMLVLAIRVVGSFRAHRYGDRAFDGTSLTSIASTLAQASVEGDRPPRSRRTQDDAPAWQVIVGRQDLTTFTAEGLAFEGAHGTPPGSPDFMGSIVMAPLNAYIPRVLWPDKFVMDDGRWFNVAVLGAPKDTVTAMGMGPTAYLNFAGGLWMVFAGFALIGFMQRVIWDMFRGTGIGGWIVFLGLLPGLAQLPSSVGGFLAGFLRQVPFVLLAQYLVLNSPGAKTSVPLVTGGRASGA